MYRAEQPVTKSIHFLKDIVPALNPFARPSICDASARLTLIFFVFGVEVRFGPFGLDR